MKTLCKISVLAVMLLLSLSVASAQFSVGLRGGINLAKWKWDIEGESADEYLKNLPAPYVSVPIEYQFTSGFALQAEPGFIQQGTRTYIKEEFPDNGEMYKMEFDSRTMINYLSMPVLAKGILSMDKVRLFVAGGPQVAYALNGKIKMEETTVNGETVIEKTTENIDWDKANLTRFDFALVLGGGIELNAGPGAVVIDARYILGMQNLYQEKGDGGLDELFSQKINNRGIGLTAGYLIPLGK